jgi:hypothetical protein
MQKHTICLQDGGRLVITPASDGQSLSVGILRQASSMARVGADDLDLFIFGLETARDQMRLVVEATKRMSYSDARAL